LEKQIPNKKFQIPNKKYETPMPCFLKQRTRLQKFMQTV
jgi:hypothetical protein